MSFKKHIPDKRHSSERDMRKRRKDNVHIVRDNGKAAEPVSAASAEEQARFLNLADTALNQKPGPTPGPAGSPAHKQHEALKREPLDTLEQLQRERETHDAA